MWFIINSGIGKETSVEIKENKVAIIGDDPNWGVRKTFYEVAQDGGYRIISNGPCICIPVVGNYGAVNTGKEVISLLKKEGTERSITELYFSTHGVPYAIDLYNSGNNIYLDNMTDFCESFVYENDSATVSDLAELYNKGIFSYDIKIILGGCYNGARHSDYPMPDKNKDANYQWKINTHIENIAQQISRKLPNAKIKANRIQVSSGNFNKPIYYKGGIEIDASSFYRI